MGNITYEETKLVSRHRGTMPAILTCLHGGDKQPPGVPNPRTGVELPRDCRFERNTDRFTRTITRGIAQALFDVFGEAPYVVIAKFDRAFIDGNRRESDKCAFEDLDAQPFYAEYHNTIRNFVDEIRADNGGLGLLFDIHGTTRIDHDPADVYLGTLNRCAISNLLSRDSLAMSRRRSLPGFTGGRTGAGPVRLKQGALAARRPPKPGAYPVGAPAAWAARGSGLGPCARPTRRAGFVRGGSRARQRLVSLAGRHQAEMYGKVRRCLQARKSAVGVSGTSGSYPCGEVR